MCSNEHDGDLGLGLGQQKAFLARDLEGLTTCRFDREGPEWSDRHAVAEFVWFHVSLFPELWSSHSPFINAPTNKGADTLTGLLLDLDQISHLLLRQEDLCSHSKLAHEVNSAYAHE